MSDLGSTSTPAPGWEQQQPGRTRVRRQGRRGPRAGSGGAFAVGRSSTASSCGVVQGVLIVVARTMTSASVLTLVIGIGYYAGLEGSRTGQTLGKKALGIRVIDANDGGPIGFGRGVIRYFGRIISAIPLGLGYWLDAVGSGEAVLARQVRHGLRRARERVPDPLRRSRLVVPWYA